MKSTVNRTALLTAGFVFGCSLVLVLAAVYLVNKHQWAEGRLAEIEPRYARLLGLEASRAELGQALTESTALIGQLVYPSSLDTSQAGLDAQQRVRNVLTAAGLVVFSSQVLAPKVEGAFDRISLTFQLEGELPAVQKALLELSRNSPRVNFEGVSMQTVGPVKSDVPQRLGVQFNVFILRARP